MTTNNRHSSSFRDPSGYIFQDQGVIKRAILPLYFKQYEALNASGLFQKLQSAGLLIPHEEVANSNSEIIIQPEQLSFMTYPYEWSFMQYKEAALLTLKIQKFAVEHGFSLKDASAFNVTFHKGRMLFIDTLSFDFYEEGQPWRAYKQFIMHFFGPLLLAKYTGADALKLMSTYLDGIPVDMLAAMLPFKTKLNPFLYTNIHLLAKFENKYSEDYDNTSKVRKLSKRAMLNMIEGLYDYIKKMKLENASEWGNYYDKTNYEDAAFKKKSDIINTWIKNLNVKTLIDVGGNDGTFVRKIDTTLEEALVCDIDNNAVDANYVQLRRSKETNMLPFMLDVLNPSAAIGFNNKERDAFLTRISSYAPDMTMALAVIHHMSLSGNIPFEMSAEFFASFSKHLIIEFPKRNDSWVQRLLNTKGEFKAHFDFYSISNFETAYAQYFDTIEILEIEGSERVMYLLKTKDD
ncbi:class I SAM-dependent methyltransferase [Psychroserpens sp.]|uniref:class I SAM-dependent methyltransferase n=1 Tax=Psychroserpens sp. TaxID=2020870 RepID=UPI001B2B35EE|nr:class I SAM-dependent methyltransferase [Psychroserpens sp.]MBO6606137.1 class I SAM-dependent methyltransferase [Psychroserpens sp.]MBO6652491.1 class I SAM-dependent methyltransferase [Psychroserpens sp.]MBO6681737.1 class I SAM-dependent methyltransferase [Psychroserpens sp.]MBO6749512.1 class I SAM-dependent methyltransferase [Psychroserpens sp.]MBO6914043.1 class I SAM-dependent methyltransferase [Psychroserpens sp.]